ncbi:hypothetical protein CgunFtcFv8_012499 [Champsocephalus gunnari]|uniref:Uncharacterized protein n=1 Tax=Champsocephalus gunnari TaxID=52237 RepID=A0AAN8HSR1_CHAGU|nr:hypothetical protein CgunFtcFv8_012499 [Champsocephalus gunnari]
MEVQMWIDVLLQLFHSIGWSWSYFHIDHGIDRRVQTSRRGTYPLAAAVKKPTSIQRHLQSVLGNRERRQTIKYSSLLPRSKDSSTISALSVAQYRRVSPSSLSQSLLDANCPQHDD